MSKARAKKLTIADISKEVSQYEKLKKVTFEDGRYTEIYEKFDPDKVNEMIDEFSHFISELEKRTGHVDAGQINKYIYIYIVKYFSTIALEESDDFEERANLFNNMSKSRYVLALQHEFDKNELAYVFDVLNERIKNSIDMIEVGNKMKEELAGFIKNDKRIKNKDVLAEVFLGEELQPKGSSEDGKKDKKTK